MDIVLQYFDDCPSWRVTDAHLRRIVAEHPGATLRYRQVETIEDAERVRFHGSPSVLVDGVDAFAADPTGVGLACRVYPTPTGPAGSPTLDQLRSALGLD